MDIATRLLKGIVERFVSEKMEEFLSEVDGITQGMTAAEVKAAKLLIMDLVENSAGEFYAKMRKEAAESE